MFETDAVLRILAIEFVSSALTQIVYSQTRSSLFKAVYFFAIVAFYFIVLGIVIFQNQHIKVDNKVNNKVYNNLTINCI